MVTVTVPLAFRVKSPDDTLRINWETYSPDGSGSTVGPAYLLQHEIDKLQAAGYAITGVELA